MALHIDEDRRGTELPLDVDTGPVMIIRLQPIAGGLCRFSYTVVDEEISERAVIDITDVVDKIVTTGKAA